MVLGIKKEKKDIKNILRNYQTVILVPEILVQERKFLTWNKN